jgi:hypothetical protein
VNKIAEDKDVSLQKAAFALLRFGKEKVMQMSREDILWLSVA